MTIEVKEFSVPDSSTVDQLMAAADYINMMALGKFDGGQFVVAVEWTVGGPHPQAYFSMSVGEYKHAGNGGKKWKAHHNQLKEQYLKNQRMMEAQGLKPKSDGLEFSRTKGGIFLPNI
jgi:hypothetical protein